jgi:hypothetical protein
VPTSRPTPSFDLPPQAISIELNVAAARNASREFRRTIASIVLPFIHGGAGVAPYSIGRTTWRRQDTASFTFFLDVCLSCLRAFSRLGDRGSEKFTAALDLNPLEIAMSLIRKLHRSAAALAVAMACAAPTITWAGVGQITHADLTGQWVATLVGFTGCGQHAMHVSINMNNAGSGAATITNHGQCGNSVLTGQSFKIISMNSNGTGTAGLTCGTGCGWTLRFQVSPDRTIMNLVDVDPINPNNFLAGVAVHF